MADIMHSQYIVIAPPHHTNIASDTCSTTLISAGAGAFRNSIENLNIFSCQARNKTYTSKNTCVYRVHTHTHGLFGGWLQSSFVIAATVFLAAKQVIYVYYATTTTCAFFHNLCAQIIQKHKYFSALAHIKHTHTHSAMY